MRTKMVDLPDEPPSRVSRVVVIVCTLGVALIAAWVFAPILLANYAATVPAVPRSPAVALEPLVPEPAPATTATAVAAPVSQ